MRAVDWPANIRFCPVGDSYDELQDDALLRTSMDAGPAKVRQRFTAIPESVRMTLPRMSLMQYAQFKTWHKVELMNGALPFQAQHPLTRAMRSFRFVTPPRYNRAGRSVVVHLDLELLP
ncbi:hypothetical protein [Tritonibacter mobilis]|uniref:hypothetical protein n=1 Tax=Tritonibacter mobilis TaxID=379347 RepID=UPI001C084565|nr:hypothetical protein [Tritonibacter mobilis]MBU3035930.1 hypothetical protein [Tritonibacter mobilis]WHQ85350.1 hypothetical protein OMR53_21975 [Tritonibacter mobilis]